jgi:hypothetical protein
LGTEAEFTTAETTTVCSVCFEAMIVFLRTVSAWLEVRDLTAQAVQTVCALL